MPVSTIGGSSTDDAAGSTPFPRPPKRTGTGMLTLGWAVDQSRRVLRARSRGKKVHPDGMGTPSSRGSDGTPATPNANAIGNGARSPESPRRVFPCQGQGTCLDVVMTLMGFGRRGKNKALDAAGRLVKQSQCEGGQSRGKSPGGMHRRVKTPLASTPENGVALSTPGTASKPSRSESRRHGKSSSRRESRGDRGTPNFEGGPPPSRSASMRATPLAGGDNQGNMWNNPSPASRGDLMSNDSSLMGGSRFGDDGWGALRAAQARRELFSTPSSAVPSDRTQSRGW